LVVGGVEEVVQHSHGFGHALLRIVMVHSAGSNLALLMRTLVGIGKPRRLQDLGKAMAGLFVGVLGGLLLVATLIGYVCGLRATRDAGHRRFPGLLYPRARIVSRPTAATGEP
jgi:hypothetical protein